MSDVIPLTLYMLISPIILIPCLFVGACNLRFPLVLLLGWLCSSIGALFTVPLIHFFVVSSPVPSSGNALLNSMVAGVIAGTIITGAMYVFSHQKKSGVPSQSQGSDGGGD